MKKKYILLLIIVSIAISCKTTTDKIVFDKKITKLELELKYVQKLIDGSNLTDALNKINDNLKLYPDNIDLLLYKGWVFLKEGKTKDSEKIFNFILEKNKKIPLAYLGLARIKRIEKKYEESKSLIKKSLSISSIISETWFENGLISYEEKKYKEALVDFTKAYTMNIKNRDASFFRFMSSLKAGKEMDEVKYIWDDLVKTNNLSDYFFLYLSDFLYEKGNKEETFKILEQGLKLFPSDKLIMNNQAYYYLLSYAENQDKELLLKIESLILKCVDENITPEIADTYLMFLEAKGDQKTINSELSNYKLKFPDSDIIIKWIKKTN